MWTIPTLMLACSSAPEPPEPSPLDRLAEQQLTHTYGAALATTADSIAVHRKDDHHVYVTRGGAGSPFRHELVLRVRNPGVEAPAWPASLLRQLASTEQQLSAPFGPGDRLTDITLSDVELPYRHVVFRNDPVLMPIDDVGFLQVLPIDDLTWEDLKIVPPSLINDEMNRRTQNDPLGLVD